MEALPMATTASINTAPKSHMKFCEFRSFLGFRTKPRRKICAFSANGSGNSNNWGELDKWDQMELKFGQMMGEDPNLTRAKIMGRKSDPNVSYLEVEKSFYKKKGKARIIEEVPFDVSDDNKPSNSLSLNGLNLVRPVPKKGVKFEVDTKPIKPRIKVPSEQVKKPVNTRGSVPNVILRKPTTFTEDDIGLKESSKMSIKPNLHLRMGREQTKEDFTDMTLLLKKPEPMISDSNREKEQEPSGEIKAEATIDLTYLARPQLKQVNFKNNVGSSSSYDMKVNLDSASSFTDSAMRDIYADPEEGEKAALVGDSDSDDLFARGLQQNNEESVEEPSVPLIGKPNRLDQTAKVTVNLRGEQSDIANPELETSTTSTPIKEFEENDWRRAEDLIETSGRDDVELVSASTRGFVVSFGSSIGFLPYRNLSPRWKFLAFESWLRRKGVDPSKYKQNLGIIGNNGILDETPVDLKNGPEINEKLDPEISPNMGLDDLLRLYDQEKLIFLSSFVGQKIKVNVTLADRKTRRLIFSLKPKEKEEMIDKKRTLMARLSVGDVVKCQIKKITYFGIFVEVEAVPALIHQTEVSWDATLDPASYYKVGQIVEAKVHQLDFSLGRIFLSLKEITPDPLIEALEAVIGDKDYLDGKLKPAQDDEEWVDVETLIKELQQFEGIESVSKGRCFLSPGLAPTFQVYMASMFENEYKLLARAGNKVQEVIVQTSLSKEDMKSAILTCTNRVE